jgi:hypothetical protein
VAIEPLLSGLGIPQEYWPEKREAIDNRHAELLAAVVLAAAFPEEARAVAESAQGGA